MLNNIFLSAKIGFVLVAKQSLSKYWFSDRGELLNISQGIAESL